jgi:hypothetical protein
VTENPQATRGRRGDRVSDEAASQKASVKVESRTTEQEQWQRSVKYRSPRLGPFLGSALCTDAARRLSRSDPFLELLPGYDPVCPRV